MSRKNSKGKSNRNDNHKMKGFFTMNEQKKATDMTSGELTQWFDSLESADPVPEYYFSNPDPYAKVEPIPYEQRRHDFSFDTEGNIRVKNLSAYWIPELTITEVIHGTVYTVTGSYEGTESFVRKLERITSKKFAESLEDSK